VPRTRGEAGHGAAVAAGWPQDPQTPAWLQNRGIDELFPRMQAELQDVDWRCQQVWAAVRGQRRLPVGLDKLPPRGSASTALLGSARVLLPLIVRFNQDSQI
jgi:hypothetical protein